MAMLFAQSLIFYKLLKFPSSIGKIITEILYYFYWLKKSAGKCLS